MPLGLTLLEGIQVNNGSASYFALSETGVLVYRLGGGVAGGFTLIWVGRDGSEEVLDPTFVGAFEAPRVSPDGRKGSALMPTNHDSSFWRHQS